MSNTKKGWDVQEWGDAYDAEIDRESAELLSYMESAGDSSEKAKLSFIAATLARFHNWVVNGPLSQTKPWG